jgi:hypothetical protein
MSRRIRICFLVALLGSLSTSVPYAIASKTKQAKPATRQFTPADCIRSGFLGSGNYYRGVVARKFEFAGAYSDVPKGWWDPVCRESQLSELRESYEEIGPRLLGYLSAKDYVTKLDECLNQKARPIIKDMEFALNADVESYFRMNTVERKRFLPTVIIRTGSADTAVGLCSNDRLKANTIINLEIRPALTGSRLNGSMPSAATLPDWSGFGPR